MARPVCKGFCRDRRLISLLQRIRPRRSPPGQDGDTRAPVLINSSASCAVFNIRLPERRLTVGHLVVTLSQTSLALPALSLRPNEFYTATDTALASNGLPRCSTPRRSSPACWPRRRPRHCDGSCSSALSPTGQAACRARPHRAEPHALHGSAACASICCRAC